MNKRFRIMPVAPKNPQVKAFAEAELSLFAHYGLEVKPRYVDLKEPNIRIRVLEVGSGRPVLIVPGGNGDAFVWASLMAELKDWRLIVLDRPGGGLSDFVDPRQVDFRELAVKTLSAVLDSFGMDSTPILCNSMGGLWSFWLALDQSRRVSRMVQLGSTALFLNTRAPLPMRLMSVPILGRLVVGRTVPRSVDTALQAFQVLGSAPAKLQALPREFAETMYASRHLPAYQDSWRTLQERVVTISGSKTDLQLNEPQLKMVEQPVLFVWGDNDPFGGPDIGRRAVKIMPRASLQEIQAGHLPFLDEPTECARIVRQFLASSA